MVVFKSKICFVAMLGVWSEILPEDADVPSALLPYAVDATFYCDLVCLTFTIRMCPLNFCFIDEQTGKRIWTNSNQAHIDHS